MAELKTKKTDANVREFIATVEHPQRRNDAFELLAIFEEAIGMDAALWGDSIIGFGEYHYKSDRSKQEGDWPLTGFSPRKQNMTVYIMPGFSNYQPLLAKLGKYKSSVSCLYFTKLSNIDREVLKQLIIESVAEMKARYGVA